MKRGLNSLYLIFIVIFSISVSASIYTTSLTPASANMCGANSETLELIASGINNTGTLNFTYVDAVLILNSSLSYVTNSTVSLGSINVSSQSSINPSWTVKCTNQTSIQTSTLYIVYVTNSGNYSSLSNANSTVKVFTADVTVPSITNSSPSGSLSNSYTTLEVNTNENAVCKYGTSSGVSYSSMSNTFSTTGNLNHRQTIENLADGSYNYYVRCKDNSENVMGSDYTISFTVNSPPSAILTLSPKSPIKEGLVKINLTTSESVVQSPSLKFTYDGTTFTNIPLTGSGTSWIGFLTIVAADNGKVGSFIFEGDDFDGKKGTIINSGNLFLVDTKLPLAPGSITVEKFDDDLKISWVHSGDDVSYYNIYRTKTSGQYSGVYVNTTGKSYVDNSVTKNGTFFYKVSAVDAAGNEGPLTSEGSLQVEVSVSSKSTIEGGSSVVESAKSEEVKVVNLDEKIANTLKEIDTLLDKISEKRNGLKDFEKSKEFSLLKIDDVVKQRRTEFLRIKKELGRLDNDDSKEKVDEYLASIELIKKEIIVGMEYGTKVQFDSSSVKEDVGLAVDEVVKSENVIVDKDDAEDYKGEMFELQKEVKVEITPLILEHLDGSKENYVLVKKVVNTNDLDDFVLIETIPKSVVEDAKSLLHDAVVVNNDPVLKFDSPEIYYIIKKDVKEDLVKTTKLIVLSDYKEFIGVKDEKKGFLGITGFAVGGLSGIDFENVAIAVGLILALGLGFYYLRMDSSEEEYVAKEVSKRKKVKTESVIEPVEEKNEFVPLISLIPKGQEVDISKVRSLNYANLPYLLEQAETYAHSWKFEEAMKLYKMMLANNDKKMEGNTKKQFSRFYKKMCLMMKVKKLEDSISSNDPVATNYLLNDVARVYNELLKGVNDSEKEFLKSVANYHKSYSGLFTK